MVRMVTGTREGEAARRTRGHEDDVSWHEATALGVRTIERRRRPQFLCVERNGRRS